MSMYERKLINYIPHIIRDVKEYKSVLNDGEEAEVESLWLSLDDALNDQFIHSATENGVSRWEKLLKISPKATATLDERKFTILSKLNGQLPFTIRRLEEILMEFCGEGNYLIDLDHNNYILNVKLGLSAKSKFDDVTVMLRRIVPANLIINVSIMFNTHRVLSAYTHRKLSEYTHYGLRNEPIK